VPLGEVAPHVVVAEHADARTRRGRTTVSDRTILSESAEEGLYIACDADEDHEGFVHVLQDDADAEPEPIYATGEEAIEVLSDKDAVAEPEENEQEPVEQVEERNEDEVADDDQNDEGEAEIHQRGL
jgi:hypothetical protein